ncbi:MAG: hypothetical protein AAFY33_19410 [Cyanobacteria bacterium J06643_4]
MMFGKRLVLIASLGIALVGCREPKNYSSEREFLEREIDGLIDLPVSEVDLSEVTVSGWSRVCVMGPYSNNEVAETLLGFPWDMEAASSVERYDNVTLLAFVTEDEVVTHVDYPRVKGDFSQLGNVCIDRDQAIVSKRSHQNGRLGFMLNTPLGQPSD